MIDVSGDSIRQSQHALTLTVTVTVTVTLNPNPVTLRTSDPSDQWPLIRTSELSPIVRVATAFDVGQTVWRKRGQSGRRRLIMVSKVPSKRTRSVHKPFSLLDAVVGAVWALTMTIKFVSNVATVYPITVSRSPIIFVPPTDRRSWSADWFRAERFAASPKTATATWHTKP